jgi:hypothetical protein
VGPRTGLDALRRHNFFPYRNSNSNPSVVQSVVSRYTDCALLVIRTEHNTSYLYKPSLRVSSALKRQFYSDEKLYVLNVIYGTAILVPTVC